MELYAAIYVDNRPVARSFHGHQPVARRADAVEVLLAGGDDSVLHVEFFCETLDRAPARVRMLDVGLLVQPEEFQILIGQLEELPPALALQAEPAVLLHDAGAVAGNVGALGAGVGDDAFEPMAVAHQTLPGRPG